MRSATTCYKPAAEASFERTTIQRRDLGPRDVLIKVAHVGICHSDIHATREECGETLFPLDPSPEIAGTVQEIGSDVDKYTVGDGVASSNAGAPLASLSPPPAQHAECRFAPRARRRRRGA
jgi:D-arabinose 1-dehydrogenase-like Zn-dependent alcohol dehydrogenase